MKHAALLPSIVVALLSVLAYFWPEPWLYQREAILNGQWWRLMSGHWVHFNGLHLLANLAVVLPSVWILRGKGWGWLLLFITANALVIGVGLLIFEPELGTYGGLSGIAIALLTSIALLWLVRPEMRIVGGIMLALLITKVFFADLIGFKIVPFAQGIETVQLSHALGFLTGACIALAGLR